MILTLHKCHKFPFLQYFTSHPTKFIFLLRINCFLEKGVLYKSRIIKLAIYLYEDELPHVVMQFMNGLNKS